MSKAIKTALSASVLLGLYMPVDAIAKDNLQAQVDDLGKQVAELQKQLDSVTHKKKAVTKTGKKKKVAFHRTRAENFTDAVGESAYHAASVTTSPTLGLLENNLPCIIGGLKGKECLL